MTTREFSSMPSACVHWFSVISLVLAGAVAAPGAGFAQQATPQPLHSATPPAAASAPTVTPAPVTAPAPASSVRAPTAPALAPAAGPAAVAPSAPTASSPVAPAPSNPGAAPSLAHPTDAVPTNTLPDAPLPATSASILLPHDLSPWGMFMAADMVVKTVMLGLAFASVVTWTVAVVKVLELFVALARARRGLSILRKSTGLAPAARTLGLGKATTNRLVQAALAEVEASRGLPAEGIKERVAISLSRIDAYAARRMQVGTGLLATIGATAPFVGLFGTVWGIMNSFIGISKAQTTNLAVVAPGIAEALLATAIGLVAAIPAVVIYNVFARAIGNYKATLADSSSEVLRHLSRDLDRQEAGLGASPSLRAAAE
ncbi:tonB-system energizer ExbB [Xanthobacter sp. DSM 24535]|uniref:tonB-system energizer ExbB n=1 Tax=Roseixanthobacter psychrophilus TaxID=3119917 RepID=UPI0037269C61